MNDIVQYSSPRMEIVPVEEIKARVNAIKKVITDAMQENVHFGKIPGTDKPSLYKPGAEMICATFRIAVRFHVEDLSSTNLVRYRVTCQGVSQDGQVLGESIGEASTAEEKYRWRRVVCDEEFDAAPEHLRRVKYGRGQGGSHYTQKQIMTNAADSANTILKMAQKRALVGMTLTVTGCSDIFSQDLEDQGEGEGVDDAPKPPKTPQSKSSKAAPKAAPAADFGLGERKWVEAKIKDRGLELAPVLAEGGIESLNDLTPEAFAKIKAFLMRGD